MKITSTLSFLILLFTFGCQNSPKSSNGVVILEEKPTKENRIQPEFTGNIQKEKAASILSTYLSIKDALVSGDSEKAAGEAKSLLPMVSGDTDQTLKIIYSNIKAISESDDVAQQRVHFYTLSEAVYAVMKVSKTWDIRLYKQYCPMAFNETGAWWLSEQEEVVNPYFGDEMLHCGMVQEEF